MIVLRNKIFSFWKRTGNILKGAGLGALISQIIACSAGNSKGGSGFNKFTWFVVTLSGTLLGALCGNSIYNKKRQKERMDEWVDENRESLQKLVSNNCPKNLDKINQFCKESEILNYGFRKYSVGCINSTSSPDEEDLIKSVGYTFYASKVLEKNVPNYNSVPVIASAFEIYDLDDLIETDKYNEDDEISILTYSRSEGFKDDKGRVYKGPKDFVLNRINEFDEMLNPSEGWDQYKERLIKLANQYLY